MEPRVKEGEIRIPYQWTTGKVIGTVLAALRERQILGGKCRACGKVWVPAYDYCPTCDYEFLEADLVPVGPGGTVRSFTIVERPLYLAPAPPPYALVAVRLRGADTDLLHLVRDRELLSRLAVGREVTAEFVASPAGSLNDIRQFVPVE